MSDRRVVCRSVATVAVAALPTAVRLALGPPRWTGLPLAQAVFDTAVALGGAVVLTLLAVVLRRRRRLAVAGALALPPVAALGALLGVLSRSR